MTAAAVAAPERNGPAEDDAVADASSLTQWGRTAADLSGLRVFLDASGALTSLVPFIDIEGEHQQVSVFRGCPRVPWSCRSAHPLPPSAWNLHAISNEPCAA
ncbi:hypothetical protein [Streptomyces lydicus]|uniref:hypothetical protein n=1 Tax=Streptomyces lydicus TaxID=47763 RepID=UPI003788CB23